MLLELHSTTSCGDEPAHGIMLSWSLARTARDRLAQTPSRGVVKRYHSRFGTESPTFEPWHPDIKADSESDIPCASADRA